MVTVKPATGSRLSGRIVRDARILGGEPTVKGTRVPVRAIVLTRRHAAETEHLCRAFPMLTRTDVEAALAFYEANREEIDRFIAEDELDDAD
jgi:uncharacterized protein (DUF433 family)